MQRTRAGGTTTVKYLSSTQNSTYKILQIQDFLERLGSFETSDEFRTQYLHGSSAREKESAVIVDKHSNFKAT